MSMQFVEKGTIGAVMAVGLMISGASQATLMNPTITGANTVWAEGGTPGLLENQGPVASQAQLEAVISTASPIGSSNVELNKFGAEPATTLSGQGDLGQATFMSLTAADWLANGAALVTSYVATAAGSLGIVLDTDQQAAVEAAFVAPSASLGGLAPWQLVSDPNIEAIQIIGDTVGVSLAGFVNAAPLFSQWFGIDLPFAQASEVVKVSYNGATKYLYSFAGFQNDGFASADGSYDGYYPIEMAFTPGQVPVPATLALLLLGAGLLKRRLG